MSPPPVPLLLCVDDQEVSRYAKTRTLRHAGYEVVEADSGRSALAMVEQARPALVLLDVRLPDVNGIDVCRIIKQRWPTTMVLQTSATFTSAADRVRGLDGGADAYLTFPADTEELVAGVRALLRLHAAEESVRALNETLEQRIAERTDALQRANERLTEQMAQRERAEAALVQSQKLEAVGQLTSVMAHDFNNVLAGIQGYLLLLRRAGVAAQAGDSHAELVDRALRLVHRGGRLTSRVLSFSQTRPLRTERVDVRALLLDMEDWLRQSTGKAVQLHVDAGDAPSWATTDANQLELAVLNLAINSRDALPHGGRVEVGLRSETVAADEPDLAAGDYAVLTVRDDGTGMPQEVLQRAFEPFYTTKPHGRGTGLGLAQVHALARHSGGTARLRSGIGQGTEVALWLRRAPAVAAPAPQPGPAGLELPELPASDAARGHVLLVDDDADVRTTMAAWLVSQGLRVDSAGSGLEALELLERIRPDGLVLDLTMPGMSGLEVARRVRARWPAMRVVFVSGNAGSPVLEREFPGTRLLRKPVDPALLVQAFADVAPPR